MAINPTPIEPLGTPLPDPSDEASYGERGREMWRWETQVAAPGMLALAQQTYENAEISQQMALVNESLSHHAGDWHTLTGALSVPASVRYLNPPAQETYWALAYNVADVTEHEPGVSDAWIEVSNHAIDLRYDNEASGLAATNVQAAIDEVVSGTAALSNPNMLINGDFRVNQLSLSGAVTLAAGEYGHDGWKAGDTGCTYTFATSGGLTTVTLIAGTLRQQLEATDVQAGTYTLSWQGTAQGRITPTGAWSSSGVSATLTGGVSRLVEFAAPGTLTNVKFEAGAVPTPYLRRPLGEELARCQRYFETGVMQWSSYTSAATGTHTRVAFRVTKRATPTLSYVPITATNVSTFDIRDPSVDGARWYCITSAAGMFTWDGTWTASSRL